MYVRLDDDLEKEGYEREVIRRIQEMRKQLDLVVSEFISVEVLVNNVRVFDLLNKNSRNTIAGEVLAVVPHKGVLFSFLKPGDRLRAHDSIKDWEIEGARTVSMTIGISRQATNVPRNSCLRAGKRLVGQRNPLRWLQRAG
jgi:isoleucyl-tRNA synthetase